jgi:hypothetical protein
MLALMFDPTLDDEAFYNPPGLGDVLPDIPADRTVALSNGPESAERCHELIAS